MERLLVATLLTLPTISYSQDYSTSINEDNTQVTITVQNQATRGMEEPFSVDTPFGTVVYMYKSTPNPAADIVTVMEWPDGYIVAPDMVEVEEGMSVNIVVMEYIGG